MVDLFRAGRPAPVLVAIVEHREVRRLGVFLCVGLLGLGSDAAVFTALHGAGLSLALARAASLACATGVTWQINRFVTFAPTGRAGTAEMARYGLVTLCAQGFSYAFFLAVSQAAPALPAIAILVTGAALATALSFTGQRLFTFRAV